MIRLLVSNTGKRVEAIRRVARRFPSVILVETPRYPDEPIDAEIEFTPQGLVMIPRGEAVEPTPKATPSATPVGWLWAHEARFAPSARAIKRSLDAGELGAAGLVRIHDWRIRGEVDLDGNLDRDFEGRLAQQLDLVCWLVAATPSVVSACALADDYLQVHLGFPNHAMALIDCAACLPVGAKGYRSLSVVGSAGAAYADDHRNLHLALVEGGPQAILFDEGEAALIASFAEFLEMLATGRAPSCGDKEWRRSKKLWQTVQASLAANEAISLGDDSE